MWSSAHFPVAYQPASQMVTEPPPYSPAVIVPANDAYSSGWSSVGTASRLLPGSSGGPFGTAQLFRTPSRSRRRSQCTRSPVRPRGGGCSWTTRVSSSPTGGGWSGGGTGSAVRAGSRLARYSASGSSRRPGTSGAAAGALGRGLVGARALLRRRGLRGRRPGRGGLLRGGRLLRGLLRGRLLRRGALGRGLRRRGLVLRGGVGGVIGVGVVAGRGGAALGALDAAAQRAHQVDHRGAVVGDLRR